MTIAAADAFPARPVTRAHQPAGFRLLWLAAGALLWLFAVGGRWDLPLAAWLFPIFMLRFTRAAKPAGLLLVWLASIAAALFWVWQMAIPTPPTTILACILFGTVFALPFAADRLAGVRLDPIPRLMLFPAVLTACEFAMGVFSPLGTAYGLLAVTQSGNLPLVQLTALLGPYAIGFLIGWFATTANWLWENGAAWRTTRTIPFVYAATLLTVLIGGEAWLALRFPVSTPAVAIAGISPEIPASQNAMQLAARMPQDQKGLSSSDRAVVQAAFAGINDQLLAETRRAAAAGARIVFWSENSAMLLSDDAPAFIARASALAKELGIYLSIADRIYRTEAPYGRDETHMMGPDGAMLWTYQKSHPIPGLESYTPGSGIAPVIETPYGRIANVICYDADFPAMMHADADIMLVPGGDWPEMGRVHTLNMASLRAIENGYALVRQDYNGLSAAFDAQGHVLAAEDTTAPAAHIMLVDVPTRGAATLYRLTGDLFAWAAVAGSLLLIGLALVRRRPAD